jgi:hypothetical protein
MLRFYPTLATVLFAGMVSAQTSEGLISSYYFTGDARDGAKYNHGKVRGASLAPDRFGNANAAYCFDGRDDYITLGSGLELRQPIMSISLWVKISDYKHSARNYNGVNFVSARVRDAERFYEAYGIGMNEPTRKIGAGNTSMMQVQTGCLAKERTQLNRWYHVVHMFDSDTVYLYIDGRLQQKNYKGFFSNYLPGDSVVLGFVGNHRLLSDHYNYSWFNGCLDDLKFYSRLLTPEEIMDLYREPDPRLSGQEDPDMLAKQLGSLFSRYWYVPTGIFAAFVAMGLFLVRQRRVQRRNEEKRLLENRLMQMEMKALRSQINPHFIFNAFNSIQRYILKNERENANTYLVRFSQLVRSILELSKKELISLAEEIATIGLYLEVESMRFKHAFQYRINVSDSVDTGQVRLPPLIIQPFVENAIWHGLLLKEGMKELDINIISENGLILVEIIDNGIGREAAAAFRNKDMHHRSFGMEITRDRLEVLRKAHNLDIRFEVMDCKNERSEPTGTRVVLYIRE